LTVWIFLLPFNQQAFFFSLPLYFFPSSAEKVRIAGCQVIFNFQAINVAASKHQVAMQGLSQELSRSFQDLLQLKLSKLFVGNENTRQVPIFTAIWL
jgi:hypothetical protein